MNIFKKQLMAPQEFEQCGHRWRWLQPSQDRYLLLTGSSRLISLIYYDKRLSLWSTTIHFDYFETATVARTFVIQNYAKKNPPSTTCQLSPQDRHIITLGGTRALALVERLLEEARLEGGKSAWQMENRTEFP